MTVVTGTAPVRWPTGDIQLGSNGIQTIQPWMVTGYTCDKKVRTWISANPRWQGRKYTCTITENTVQTDCYIVVRAFLSNDESGESNEVKFTPPATDPTVDSSLDSDSDTIADIDEANVYGTGPYNMNTNGEGFSDGQEAASGTDP